jgi:hypothetical protein
VDEFPERSRRNRHQPRERLTMADKLAALVCLAAAIILQFFVLPAYAAEVRRVEQCVPGTRVTVDTHGGTVYDTTCGLKQ